MTDVKTFPNVTFLMRLRHIEKSGFMVRDILLLYLIMANPGINGLDAANLIGFTNRSSLQSAFGRMIRRGIIEDRRPYESKAVSMSLYVTQAGKDFWNELIGI